jgi:transcriptional regulator with XRE-family HTH domain
MTAPIVPPTGRNPASPGQRQDARDHLTRLRQQGGTYRSIAEAGMLSPNTVYALATGQRRAQPGTATAVLTVITPALPHARLDSTGTRLRLRALHVMGHGSARIARATGVHPATIRKLVRGETRTVSAPLRDAVAGLYDAWWDKRAPARTRFERAAATAARKRAMAGDWCAAAALDDDWLDIPGYQPEYGWKPATGTGTAPDVHPSALPQEKERHMADDQRLTWGFIIEVFDVLERHGYRRSDSEHTGEAIGLIRHVARIYEGTLDAPAGGYVVVPSSPPTALPPPGLPGQDAVVVSAGEVKTLLAALDDAAEYKRDRAEVCADCADQSCTTCQWRLQAAETYDQMAAEMIHAGEASAARQRAPEHAEPPGTDPHAATDKEAGQ